MSQHCHLLWAGESEELLHLSRIKARCCYAFSNMAAMEGIIQLKRSKLISLSEQELGDCDVRNSNPHPLVTNLDFENTCWVLLGSQELWEIVEDGYTESVDVTDEAAACTCQAIRLKNILRESYLIEEDLTTIYVDKKSAIALAKNPVSHSQSKHIDTRYHFIREQGKNKVVELVHCITEEQIANIFTKPLKTDVFRKLKEKLGMHIQIAYLLTIPQPIVEEAADEATKQTAMKHKQKWEDDDTYCKGYILGGLSDTLYEVYEIKFANSTAKELWDDLDYKYKKEDARNKKVPNDFCMVDNKSIITHKHELQMIMNQIISEGHTLDKSYQVSTIISKLPFTRKEGREKLKQKNDAMTMQELVKYIQVEETSRNLDRLELEDHKSSKALK
ncbi:hypothetical protein RJ639_046100 [Escallonia herrerae]|uniref:Peptidase C1A papain C-terminal domain-containing protein n=1 Tax=Escallonia herrerae TaxID=1293975 RepID=A0AA88W857_9ASTE|nr:hypothetical protein RJ639_046100 [Escallonia herrerae]